MTHRFSWLAALCIVACGEADPVQTGTTGSRPTTASDATTSATLADSSSGDSPADAECSAYQQDCPEGFTCRPALPFPPGQTPTCQSVPANPDDLGDTCAFFGPGSDDNCDFGLVCAPLDENENLGVCLATCGGSPENPECEEETICTVGLMSYSVCAPTCHPLDALCRSGWSCHPLKGSNSFDFFCGSSLPTAGGAGTPCLAPAECSSTTTCIDAAAVPGCEGERCCSQWCDLDDPSFECDLAAQGQTCVAWGQTPPPGLANLGICVQPE